MDFKAVFSGGDMRSPKGAKEAAEYVLQNPHALNELLALLNCGDEKLQMRSADALEKISAVHPEHLTDFIPKLIEIARKATQQEVRWHMAQIAPRLELDEAQISELIPIFETYLSDKSKIVVADTLSALAHFANFDNKLKAKMPKILQWAKQQGGAIAARVRKLT